VAFMHQGRITAQGAPAELAKLARTKLLEVRCSHPLEAARLVQGLPSILNVHAFGDHLRVGTREPTRARQAIAKKLQASGVAVDSIAEASPTIEDVFVELMRT
ncbi:MAG: DUF4162 domain-containing protein, partial [Calditrichaeota bacterium]|nr:DUF4162 domain-containing protein [Calditrichota bacterium]